MDKDKSLLPQQFSDMALKSVYSDVMLFTAKTLIESPNISRDEFMRMHKRYFGIGNAKVPPRQIYHNGLEILQKSKASSCASREKSISSLKRCKP